MAMDEERRQDLRHWIDDAGGWHLEVAPDRLRGASDFLVNRLRERLNALTSTVVEITTGRSPYDGFDRSFDDLVDQIAAALPGLDRHTVATVAGAVFDAISEETDDLHDWTCFGMYPVDAPRRVDQAAHRLYDLSMGSPEGLSVRDGGS